MILISQVTENWACILHSLYLLVHGKVSMDFMGGFPMSRKGHDFLYVVVDRFSKMCILMACKK